MIIIDSNNRPRCDTCGETIDRDSCSCGNVQMRHMLRGAFSDYEIMAAFGFGSNPQETHHNPAAWQAVNAWRPANVHWVNYDLDGDNLYEWNTPPAVTHAFWCG